MKDKYDYIDSVFKTIYNNGKDMDVFNWKIY